DLPGTPGRQNRALAVRRAHRGGVRGAPAAVRVQRGGGAAAGVPGGALRRVSQRHLRAAGGALPHPPGTGAAAGAALHGDRLHRDRVAGGAAGAGADAGAAHRASAARFAGRQRAQPVREPVPHPGRRAPRSRAAAPDLGTDVQRGRVLRGAGAVPAGRAARADQRHQRAGDGDLHGAAPRRVPRGDHPADPARAPRAGARHPVGPGAEHARVDRRADPGDVLFGRAHLHRPAAAGRAVRACLRRVHGGGGDDPVLRDAGLHPPPRALRAGLRGAGAGLPRGAAGRADPPGGGQLHPPAHHGAAGAPPPRALHPQRADHGRAYGDGGPPGGRPRAGDADGDHPPHLRPPPPGGEGLPPLRPRRPRRGPPAGVGTACGARRRQHPRDPGRGRGRPEI
ncbi:MAG: hypothetical protein AVDCRST_MAG68-2580, partial [uncultured Gemmatimonadetes bacterium]